MVAEKVLSFTWGLQRFIVSIEGVELCLFGALGLEFSDQYRSAARLVIKFQHGLRDFGACRWDFLYDERPIRVCCTCCIRLP